MNRRGGFSLMELLIALGILAGSIATLMGAMSTAMLMQNRDEDLLNAVNLANNRMAEVEAEIQADIEKNKFPEEDSGSGSFDAPFENYDWEFELKKVDIPFQGLPGQNQMVRTLLKQILKDISKAVRVLTLKVAWTDREDEKPREVVLTTHVVNLK